MAGNPTTEEFLNCFQRFGVVTQSLLGDRNVSFVSFEKEQEADLALQSLNNKIDDILGRKLVVRHNCRDPPKCPNTPVMADVRDFDHIQIEGLDYNANWITPTEQNELLNWINTKPWIEGSINRRVQHYGVAFDYHTLALKCPMITEPIPEPLSSLCHRLFTFGKMPFLPDQITINEYIPGRGIGYHVDTHSPFLSAIASLSLGSGAVIEFREFSKVPCATKKRKLVYLEQGSLSVFADEARYGYEHAILSRKTDKVDGQVLRRGTRVSITFRGVRRAPCDCRWAWACDTQNPLSLDLPTRLNTP